ncbi:MAG: hypothetical protein CM15mP125_4150 [Gammaproteobacteria bacterium]|nr:MAG: hypothetical protein CM15mP125_4150 [Gammaproteobacteria bacterium]
MTISDDPFLTFPGERPPQLAAETPFWVGRLILGKENPFAKVQRFDT